MPTAAQPRRRHRSPSVVPRRELVHRNSTTAAASTSSSRSSSLRRRAPPLPRHSSEPSLRTPLSPGCDGEDGLIAHGGGVGLLLPKSSTCGDVCAPGEGRGGGGGGYSEEAKVVLSVTVEGCAGPVRAMVRLGATVGEAIAAVVDRYEKEGRSPRIAGESLQLYHSYFCFQGLNQSDKLGDVGGRSFYLRRRSNGTTNLCDGHLCSTSDQGARRDGLGAVGALSAPAAATTASLFVSLVLRRLAKLGRRTRSFLRILACMPCG